MKEYLNPLKNGGYELSNDCLCEDSIEVPEGAKKLTIDSSKTLTFWKSNNESINVGQDKKWLDSTFLDEILNFNEYSKYNFSILWQRQPINEKEYLLQGKNGDYLMESVVQLREDNVNHPSHYCGHPSGIECIEITRHHDFAIGNAIKYLWRAGLKGSDNEVQDLKKAVWYIQDKIKQLESKNVDDKTIDWIDEGNK